MPTVIASTSDSPEASKQRMDRLFSRSDITRQTKDRHDAQASQKELKGASFEALLGLGRGQIGALERRFRGTPKRIQRLKELWFAIPESPGSTGVSSSRDFIFPNWDLNRDILAHDCRRHSGSIANQLHEIRFGEPRRLCFAADAEETAEAHDQRKPLLRIDVRARSLSYQQRFLDMQLHDVHLKRVGGNVLSEWADIMHNALHLYRTLRDSRRPNFERRHRSKPGDPEFVGLVAVTPAPFLFGNRILAGSKCEPVDVGNLLDRRQIDHALSHAKQVVRCLTHGAKSQHAAPSQPPRRRHGCDVRSAIFIQAGDQRHRRTEVKNRWFDRSVHANTLAATSECTLSGSCIKISFLARNYYRALVDRFGGTG